MCWCTLSLIPYLGFCEKHYNEHGSAEISKMLILFPLDIHPIVRLLDHMVLLFFIFLRKLNFSKMVILNCTPNNSVQRFCFLHIFFQHSSPLIFFIIAILIWWYIIVVLTCISLIIRDAKLFLCTFWPFVGFLLRNIYSGSFPFSFRLFFMLLTCLSSLYILGINLSKLYSLKARNEAQTVECLPCM
jgi:hypothetical protein